MEPTLPKPEFEAEPRQATEALPAQPPINPETTPNKGQELSRETNGSPVVPPQQATPYVVPIPPAHSQTLSDDQMPQSGNDSPAVADDVDVIEKEWVDRAKKIVEETKDDPHQQEIAVNQLQADYLMKRYGKQVKSRS